MTQQSHVHITKRTFDAAHAQGIEGFEVNPPDVAKLVEITNRVGEVDPNYVAPVIGHGVGLQVERADTRLYNGRPMGELLVGHTPSTDHLAVRLNVPRNRPITEAELARRMAAVFLAPARARNAYGRQVPGGLVGAVGTALGVAGGSAYSTGESAELTGSLTGAAALLLALGGVLLREHAIHGRQYDIAQFGAAAVLRPVIVHRRPAATTIA